MLEPNDIEPSDMKPGDAKSQDLERRLSGAERLHQHERTASRVIDGKAVVITIDRNELHVLNAVGTRVWELADGRPLSEIVDEIVREFAVGRERAAADVCGFAEQLLAVGAANISKRKE